MPLMRVKLTLNIDVDQTFPDLRAMVEDGTQEEWIDVVRNFIGDFPEELINHIDADIDLIDQVSESAQVEFISEGG